MAERDTQQALDAAIGHHNAGRLRQAETIYRQVLAGQPNHPVALHLLGVIAQQAGQSGPAVELIAKALEIAPDYAEAHNNLGNIQRQLGQHEDALAGFRRAVALAPDHPETHTNIGLVLQDLGQLEAAAESHGKAIALAPDYAEAHNNLGNALLALDRLGEARDSYQKAIAHRPDIAEMHNNLGNVLWRLGQLDEAAASYRRAIDLRPDYAEAHRNLAMTLRRQGRPEDAAAHFRQAIAHGADDGETHYSLGNLLREMAQLEAAADCYRQAIARRPDHAESHNQLGMTLQEFGQFDEAVACYETALQLNPGFGAAHHNLGALRTFVAGDARIDHMQELVDDPATAEADAAPLLFALGKAYGDLGQHGRSFDCFLRGNRLKRGTVEYDGAELADTVARLRATFDGELFERFAGAGCPSDLPIFVVGMPRSGTTLVEQIIASHPAVHGAGELPYLIWLGRKLPTWLAAGRAIPEDERAIWRDLGEEYLAALRAHAPSMAHITDKLPNNFLRIGLIQMILPNATIVHCQRSPMDTCLSCFTLLFSEGQPFSYDLAELGHFYRQYEALMSHWRTVLPGRFLDLRYEDLLSDLEGQARRLIDHCGLAWDDRCLNFHQTERTVRTASLAQVRQPIYTSSRGRWRRYEHHLGPLIDALGPSADVA